MTDQDKLEFSKVMRETEKQKQHVVKLYNNEQQAKTAMYRDKRMLEKKLEKKKENLKLTKEQLETTIKQMTQERERNQQFGEVIEKIMGMVHSQEGVKQLQSMKNLQIPGGQHMSFGTMGGAQRIGALNGLSNRTSIMALNDGVRKTLRGGHGSVYLKGG